MCARKLDRTIPGEVGAIADKMKFFNLQSFARNGELNRILILNLELVDLELIARSSSHWRSTDRVAEAGR